MKRIFLCLVLCLVLLTGCATKSGKEVGTLERFGEVASNNNLFSYDNAFSYTEDSYITGAYKIDANDIQVEMVIYDTNENANKAQEHQIDTFMQIKSTGAAINKEKGNDYYKFEMVSNGYYMVTSRIDNTLIFSKTLVKNKETVEKILADMGY